MSKLTSVTAKFKTKISLASYSDIIHISNMTKDLVRNTNLILEGSTDKAQAEMLIRKLNSVAHQIIIDSNQYGMNENTATTYKGYFNMILAFLGGIVPKSHIALLKPLYMSINAWDPSPIYSRTKLEPEIEEPGLGYEHEEEAEDLGFQEPVELPQGAYDVINDLTNDYDPSYVANWSER